MLERTAKGVMSAAADVLPSSEVLVESIKSLIDLCMQYRRKAQWVQEFTDYLALIQADITSGQAAFQRQAYLNDLHQRLNRCSAHLSAVVERPTCLSCLLSSTDHAYLQEQKREMEEIRRQSIMSAMIELKVDIHNAQQKATRAISSATEADSKQPDYITLRVHDAVPPSPSFSATHHAVMAVSNLLSVLPAARSLASTLTSIYDAYNKARSRQKWMSEFVEYVKRVEGDITEGRKCFREQKFMDRLVRQAAHSTHNRSRTFAAPLLIYFA